MADLPWTYVPRLPNATFMLTPLNRPSILVVYSPSCGPSQRAQVEIDAAVRASKVLQGRVWHYNAQTPEARALLRDAYKVNITYFPTALVFRGTSQCEVYEYKDQFTAQMMERALKS